MAKKYQEMVFAGDWRYFVDLHVMRDYAATLDIGEFEDEVKDWVTGDVVHAVDDSEDAFDAGFRRGVFQFLRSHRGLSRRYTPLSIKQFCSDPGYWARSGSSDGPRLRVETAEGVRKCRKQKWATAYAMTPTAVEALLRAPCYQNNKAVQKRELGKVRAIVAGDLSTYLKMAYVARWLEAWLDGHPNSTLFYSGTQLLKLWNDMARDSKDTFLIKMPVDQSKFDHMVKKRMVEIMNEECLSLIADECATPDRGDLLYVMRLVIHAVSGGAVLVGRVRLLYEKGVISGWRLTAFYDTLANAGELNVAREWVRQQGGLEPVLSWVVQGDDIRMTVVNYSCAVLIWICYSRMGFDVNPSKFFISNHCDEFLRQVTDVDSIHGYPARAVTSLVWRNPVGAEPLRGEERIRELVGSWNDVFSRTGRWDEHCIRLMVHDVAASNVCSVEDVWRILRTPAAYGGVGMLPCDESRWLGIRKGRRRRGWVAGGSSAAVILAESWGVAAETLERMWLDNIEGPHQGGDVYEAGELFEPRKEAPVVVASFNLAGSRPPFVVMLRPEIPPSVATALVEECIVRRDWGYLRAFVDTDCLYYYDDFKSRLSRRVFLDWLQGRLPFSTPIVLGWSSLATSDIYGFAARGMWAWAIAHHRVSMSLVQRAAYTAEIHTKDSLLGQLVRVGG
jgi:hypothetical protein